MGIKKDIERTNKIIKVLHEMFDNHDEMIHDIMKINDFFEKQIENQGKMIDNIMKELEMRFKKEEDEKFQLNPGKSEFKNGQ